jgi:hypothetical protein
VPIVNGKSKVLLIFALVVLAAGIGLAVAQPGSLGGDDDDEAAQGRDTTTTVDDTDDTTDDTGDSTSTTSTSTTSSTSSSSSSSSTSAPSAGDATTTTTINEVEDSETTNTTQPGSGLGSSGAAQPGDTSDGLAATGGESLLLVGIALGTAGIAARRRPRSA